MSDHGKLAHDKQKAPIERVTETADESSSGLEMMVYKACSQATPLSLSSMNQQSLVCPLP